MKIALLGAKSAGKTAYFTGLYAEYRNLLDSPAPPPARGRSRPVDQFQFRIGLDDIDTEELLAERAEGYFSAPMQFARYTTDLDPFEIWTDFAFRTPGPKSAKTKFRRQFEICDPPGGAFRGQGDDAESIMNQLHTCDAFLVFLDGEKVLDASKSKRGAEILGHNASLGKIRDLLEAVQTGSPTDDIIPICVVISKFDKFNNKITKAMLSLVYNQIVVPLSESSNSYVICVCPVSVVDIKTPTFAGYNLQWPFVFSAAATIFRNALASRSAAEQKARLAAEMDARAAEVRSSKWFSRLKAFVNGTGVRASERRAESCRSERGRLIEIAEDDTDLARRLWGQIAALSEDTGVRVFVDGETIDPRNLIT